MPGRAHNEFETNQAVSWVHHAGFRWIYVFMVCMAWLFTRMVFTSNNVKVWMTVVFSHSIISFVLLHWIRGTPEGGTLAENVAHLTFWEQVDDGYYGTPTRRFLLLLPVLLFFFATYVSGDDLTALAFNGLCTLCVIIPKHHWLFNVRLFGIHKLD